MGGDLVDGLPVSVRGMTKPGGLSNVGKVGHSRGEETVLCAGEEERSVQALVGDLVTVAARYFADQVTGFESAQIVGDLSGRDVVRGQSSEFRGQSSEVLVGESVGVQPECQQS